MSASFSVVIATCSESVKTLRKHLKTYINGLPLCCHKKHQVYQAFKTVKASSNKQDYEDGSAKQYDSKPQNIMSKGLLNIVR